MTVELTFENVYLSAGVQGGLQPRFCVLGESMIRVADLEHRCVAVCCSVLQCVAVRCSALQCVVGGYNEGGLEASMCVGCQKIFCILLHVIVWKFSHPTHLHLLTCKR